MYYYSTKGLTPDQVIKRFDELNSKWLAENPCAVHCNNRQDEYGNEVDDYLFPCEGDPLKCPKADYYKWFRKAPHLIDGQIINVDYLNIDIVTGPLTCRKLLLHQRLRTSKQFNLAQVMAVVNSRYKRHHTMGPYFHSLDINIYPDDVSLWGYENGFIKLEVDLWHASDVAKEVREALAVAHTLKSPPKIYRS